MYFKRSKIFWIIWTLRRTYDIKSTCGKVRSGQSQNILNWQVKGSKINSKRSKWILNQNIHEGLLYASQDTQKSESMVWVSETGRDSWLQTFRQASVDSMLALLLVFEHIRYISALASPADPLPVKLLYTVTQKAFFTFLSFH